MIPCSRFPADVPPPRRHVGVRPQVISEKRSAKLPEATGVDVVVESTGLPTKRDDAAKHDRGRAPRADLAPATGPDLTVVMGQTTKSPTPPNAVISVASCPNHLAPVAKVINDKLNHRGLMMTITPTPTTRSSLTTAQGPAARAAAVSMIPTTTGAAKAVTQVLPELKGKIDGTAVRVPVVDGSLVDFTFEVEKSASIEAINQAMRDASQGAMKGIIEYTEDPIVSVDVIGNPHSAIFDAKSTMAIGDRFFKILAWYDNEYGYSGRMVDMLRLIGR
jgi:glyceraldehyde 3-phosphate dehydrogenase